LRNLPLRITKMEEVLLLPTPTKVKRKRPYRGNDAYGVLGVHPDAPLGEIKRAYLRLARQCHPDVNPSPEARQEFVRITRAYEYMMKHGELVRLQMKCKVVETKASYAEFLLVHKRARDFAGVEVDPPPFNPAYLRRNELSQRMERLGVYQMFHCPSCRWRQRCDRATGFDQVEDIHHEMRSKVLARMFDWTAKGGVK
jgi:hypothetical protein